MNKRLVFATAGIALLFVSLFLAIQYFRPPAPVGAQAVRVYLKLSDSASGNPAERERLFNFDEKLAIHFKTKQPFEYDGHEIGEGFFTMYFYGPNAEAIISTIRPTLEAFGIPAGSYLILRKGEIGSPEEQLEL